MTAQHLQRAEAEARARWPHYIEGESGELATAVRADKRRAFIAGAEWRDAHIAALLLPILERLEDYHGDSSTEPLRALYRALAALDNEGAGAKEQEGGCEADG